MAGGGGRSAVRVGRRSEGVQAWVEEGRHGETGEDGAEGDGGESSAGSEEEGGSVE